MRAKHFAMADAIGRHCQSVFEGTEQQKIDGLCALADLAADDAKKQSFWADEAGVRKALLTGVAAEQPTMRQHALRGLASLTSDVTNRQSMWADAEGARSVLVGAAARPENREQGIIALANFARETANRLDMWADADGARAALIAAAALGQPAETRLLAIRALADLCEQRTTAEEVWADEKGAVRPPASSVRPPCRGGSAL